MFGKQKDHLSNPTQYQSQKLWACIFGQTCLHESEEEEAKKKLDQWFSTAGTRPGTGTWRPFHRDLEHKRSQKMHKN